MGCKASLILRVPNKEQCLYLKKMQKLPIEENELLCYGNKCALYVMFKYYKGCHFLIVLEQ